MPSDHSSIAARHRARTLSRAKSLLKHERWLVQQHDRHQSQPNLYAAESDKQYFGESLLRRATSFRTQRSRGTSTSDAPGFERLVVSPFTSSTALINSVHTNTPATGLSSYAGSGFPWNEVNWNKSRLKLELSSNIRHLLTPYPATTTRQVSKATAERVNYFSAGELDAVSYLRQIVRRHYAPIPAATTTQNTAVVTPTQHHVNQSLSFSHPRPAPLDITSTSTSTTTDSDSNSTSNSQLSSDSDAGKHLSTAPPATNARLRPKSLQRAQTYAHPSRNPRRSELARSETSSPPPPSQPHTHTKLRTELKDKDTGHQSPQLHQRHQRHQRHRHPQLVYPYAPGHYDGPSTFSQARVLVHNRSTEPTAATLEALDKPHQMQTQRQQQQPHPPEKTIWNRTRSSIISSLASTTVPA